MGNPSVGKARQEQDQQQQQENNKSKNNQTNHQKPRKIFKFYHHSQRNTKASETKQHKIETKVETKQEKKNARITKQTKQIKERNSLTLFKTSNIFFIQISSLP